MTVQWFASLWIHLKNHYRLMCKIFQPYLKGSSKFKCFHCQIFIAVFRFCNNLNEMETQRVTWPWQATISSSPLTQMRLQGDLITANTMVECWQGLDGLLLHLHSLTHTHTNTHTLVLLFAFSKSITGCFSFLFSWIQFAAVHVVVAAPLTPSWVGSRPVQAWHPDHSAPAITVIWLIHKNTPHPPTLVVHAISGSTTTRSRTLNASS